MRTKLTFLLLTAVAFTLSAAQLWKKGEPTLPIVVSVESPEPARQAAYELAQWLDKATGETWMVTAKAPEAGQKAFYVGPGATIGQTDAPDTATLPHDGFWYQSTPEGIRVAGRDYPGGPHSIFLHPMRDVECWNPDLRLSALGDMGTWFGVHHFLEKLGFRWYMPGELGAVVPELTAIEVADETETISPAFEYRYAWLCNFPTDPKDALWYRRVGFGGPTGIAIGHSYSWMLEYKDEHPEFFALIDGQRDFTNLASYHGGGSLCLTNEELIQKWVDIICKFFQENPEDDIFPLCPNDGLLRICDCDKCQALYSPQLGEHGKFSNYVWTFSDKVARGVGARMPNKRVGTFAYEGYREVPDCLTEISPNLAVMICYVRQRFRDPAKKENVRSLIEKWSTLTDGIYFWTYPHKDYWDPWRGFPRFYPEILVEDIRENARLNTKGEFLESEAHNWNETAFHGIYDYHWPMLYHLTAYVTCKLLWNPNLELRPLLEEYYHNFYGPAYAQMKNFWETVEAATMKEETHYPLDQYSVDELQNLMSILEDAMAACPEDSLYWERINELYEEMSPYIGPMKKLKGREPMRIPFLENGTLTLDGKPWDIAKPHEFVDKFANPTNHKTTVYLAADKEGIAVTFYCYEPDMANLVTNTSKHDLGPIWDDSSVELQFCKPNGTDGVTIIITANNNCYDANWAKTNSKDNLEWTSKLVSTVQKQDDKWVVQAKLPWSDLGIENPVKGQEILLGNLYRNHPTQSGLVENTAYTSTYCKTHRLPTVYIPVILE